MAMDISECLAGRGGAQGRRTMWMVYQQGPLWYPGDPYQAKLRVVSINDNSLTKKWDTE